MNTISELEVQYTELIGNILEVFNNRKNEPMSVDFQAQVKRLQQLGKARSILAPKIQEETLVLKATKKESSPTLIRYNAKLQVLVGQFRQLFDEMKPVTPTVSPRAMEIAADPKKKVFDLFVKSRVRHLRDGYTEVFHDRVTLKEIIKAYNRWFITEGGRRLDAKELESLCEYYFGDSRGKREYCHLRVFLDEDDLEEFDIEHKQWVEAESEKVFGF